MSQAKFIRMKVIGACKNQIDRIVKERERLVNEARLVQIEFDAEELIRPFWKDRRRSEELGLWIKFESAENYRTEHQKRIQKIQTFCEKIAEETVILSAQEFADFSDCYPELGK